jgi:hypothetical protein
MLAQYLAITHNLLQNPASAGSALYNDTDLTNYINIGRGQLAGEAECIRAELFTNTVANQPTYSFVSIIQSTPLPPGVAGIFNIRRIQLQSFTTTGRQWVYNRSWEWFDFYHNAQSPAVFGPPRRWAQFGQGSSGTLVLGETAPNLMNSGSFFLDPIPDGAYLIYLDCNCYPLVLTADTQYEAIPYPWTDAIPFWAAWYALMSSQTAARMADAEKFKSIYDDFVRRARQASNPVPGRWKYEQAVDPVQMAKILQVHQQRGAA